jgi:hypothetical protein
MSAVARQNSWSVLQWVEVSGVPMLFSSLSCYSSLSAAHMYHDVGVVVFK